MHRNQKDNFTMTQTNEITKKYIHCLHTLIKVGHHELKSYKKREVICIESAR